MSILPVNPSVSDETAAPCKAVKRSRRPLFAAFLSAAIPGSGQLLLGQRQNGLILLFVFIATLLCIWPLRLPRFVIGFALISLSWINLCISAAYRAGWSKSLPKHQRPSKWWLVLLLPTAFLILWFSPDRLMLSAGFHFFNIPTISMEPTICRGDRILTDTNYYGSHGPHDQEVIVFKRDRTFFVKRLIASGGEWVTGINGVIYLNGRALQEPYAKHTGSPQPWMNDFGPIIVPSGEYFVLGDNRDLSLDSRSPQHGFVSSDSVFGKPLYVIVNFGSRRTGKIIN